MRGCLLRRFRAQLVPASGYWPSGSGLQTPSSTDPVRRTGPWPRGGRARGE